MYANAIRPPVFTRLRRGKQAEHYTFRVVRLFRAFPARWRFHSIPCASLDFRERSVQRSHPPAGAESHGSHPGRVSRWPGSTHNPGVPLPSECAAASDGAWMFFCRPTTKMSPRRGWSCAPPARASAELRQNLVRPSAQILFATKEEPEPAVRGRQADRGSLPVKSCSLDFRVLRCCPFFGSTGRPKAVGRARHPCFYPDRRVQFPPGKTRCLKTVLK